MFAVNSRYKLGLVHLQDLYYAKEIQAAPAGFDAVYYYHCQKPAHNAKAFTTMLINLSPSPEEILRSFRKSTRSEIKKTLAEDVVLFDFQTNPSWDMLMQFIDRYNDFAVKKNISSCNDALIKQIWQEQRLVLASAMYNDHAVCQFILFDADEKMVVYYGYNTRFENDENTADDKLISGANRALEYRCMLFAKEAGKDSYDLCGLTMNPDNASAGNVDQYKLGFRGEIVTEYHFMNPITMKGKIFCWLKKISGGIG